MASRNHIVVVGGGIIGLSIALELVRRGADVTVVEDPDVVADDEIDAPSGMVAPCMILPPCVPSTWNTRKWRTLSLLGPVVIRWPGILSSLSWLSRASTFVNDEAARRISKTWHGLIHDCADRYETFCSSVQFQSEFRRTSIILQYPHRKSFEADGYHFMVRRALGMDWLQQPEIAASSGSQDHSIRIRFEDQGVIENPGSFLERIKAMLMSRGLKIHRGAVRGLRIGDSGMHSVITDAGTLSCKGIVVAAGFASASLLRPLGCEAPGLRVARFSFQASPDRDMENMSRFQDDLAVPVVRTGWDGVRWLNSQGLNVSGLVGIGGPYPNISGRVKRMMTRRCRRDFGMLSVPENGEVRHQLYLSDFLPAAGRLSGAPRVFAAFGFGEHAGAAAPAISMRLADAICDHPSEGKAEDDSLLSPDRFSNYAYPVVRHRANSETQATSETQDQTDSREIS